MVSCRGCGYDEHGLVDGFCDDCAAPAWEITIDRGGEWPTRWRWKTARFDDHGLLDDVRMGAATTKHRARRKALKAKRSMHDDNVRVVYRYAPPDR